MPQIDPGNDSIRLFRLAEMVARRLAEQHEGLRKEEALLRAAIAWAKYAQRAHLKLVEQAKTCSEVKTVTEAARRRRIRTAQHLRLRLTAVIARKCGLMRDERLLKVADLALSLIS